MRREICISKEEHRRPAFVNIPLAVSLSLHIETDVITGTSLLTGQRPCQLTQTHVSYLHKEAGIAPSPVCEGRLLLAEPEVVRNHNEINI